MGSLPAPVANASPTSALCENWLENRTDSLSLKPGLGRVPVTSSVPDIAPSAARLHPPTKLPPAVKGSKMLSRRGSKAPARVSTTMTPWLRSPKRTDGTPRTTSTRSSVVAGMRLRSIPPPALVGMRSSPRGPRLCRFALFEMGTPSITMSVPNDASSAGDGPLPTRLSTELVGTVRSEICSTSSSPGGVNTAPGTSSRSPDREVAV